jgi:PBSX family phage portal protein
MQRLEQQLKLRSGVEGGGRTGRVRVLSRELDEDEVMLRKEDGTADSKQIPDPFERDYDFESDVMAAINVLRPPYRMDTLRNLPIRNAILLQCIHAMVVNCHSFGYDLSFIGEKDQEESPLSVAEKTRLKNMLEQPNDHDSFTNISMKAGTDYEVLGNAYYEVTRGPDSNVECYYHVPGERVRLCRIDSTPVTVETILMRNGKAVPIKLRRYFRRFAQIIGIKKVYFKEFGDPRPIDPETGLLNTTLAKEKQATEILHIPQYWSGSAYGVPCWINNLPAIIGMREAEMINLRYFSDNAIPAMAILVSGGSLSEDTILELQEKFVNSRGADQVHRVVVIEAVADADAAGSTDAAPQVPRLEMKPLRDAQQQDGLFLQFDEASMMKIRGSFRLPPIFVGRSDDYTRATAESSAQLAELQVFGPRRNVWDDVMNQHLLVFNKQRPQFWAFRSRAAKLVDPALILQALTVLEAMGAATPNLAIQVANELFALGLQPIKEDWATKPFEFVKMQLSNMNSQQADGQAIPNENGSVKIKKADMESLTRATLSIAKYIEDRNGEATKVRQEQQAKRTKKAELKVLPKPAPREERQAA